MSIHQFKPIFLAGVVAIFLTIALSCTSNTPTPTTDRFKLYLKRSLAAMEKGNLSDAAHEVIHAQEIAEVHQEEQIAEILLLLDQGEVHDAKIQIEQLLE